MELTTLRQLPVGAAFIRHDEYGDGMTVYIKINTYGHKKDDESFCGCGRLAQGYTGALYADIPVQEVELGTLLTPLVHALAGIKPTG